jgi:hypothetical protein
VSPVESTGLYTVADDDRPPIPCHHLRVLIVANHINGKDTHVRGLKVYGPMDRAEL